jgi:hypothetical protein
MANESVAFAADHSVAPGLARALGTRRSARLRAVMRNSGLPAEPLLDLAIELLDIASRKLSPPPIRRMAVGLGAARWRGVSAKERSRLLRRAVQARWAKQRRSRKP